MGGVHVPRCVGWRATSYCQLLGARQPAKDRSCDALIRGEAGYCLCEGGITVARVGCGPHRFRCREKCAELATDSSAAVKLPQPLTCAADTNVSVSASTFAAALPTVQTPSSNYRTADVWNIVDTLLMKHGLGEVALPGSRTHRTDWVMEGLRLGRATVDQLAAVVAGVLADVPPYPPAAFSGRGVVMVGGGLHYLIPAWASLSVLRKSGCHLPVEVWFPVAEQPSRPAVAALEGLGGVAVRTLDVVDLQQRGFALKSAALLLSSFQEVLFLDSDNLAVRDPSPLFASPQYAATGALFWRDFWDRSSVPEIHEVLRFPNEQVPKVTFESGQMVIDKARHWRGLLLAVYMNVYGKTFAELLSCYLGKGDKETFVYAMLAAGEAYWVSPQPPGSAGVVQVLCEPGRAASCRRQFMGNTMVQPGPDGLPLFFHANYEKWDLALPAAFEAYQRRWQVLAPGGQDVVGGVFLNTSYGIGYDVERHVFQVLSALRCAPWFTAYYQLRLALDDPPLPALDGFHPLPNYISFRPFYRLGWSGAYMGLFRPSLGDRLVHAYYRVLRWRLKPLERRLKGKK